MVPRAISKIFENVRDNPENSYTIRISHLEIYNEQLFDLLGDQSVSHETKVPLLIYEEENGLLKLK